MNQETIKIYPGGENKNYFLLDYYRSLDEDNDTLVLVGGSGDTRQTWGGVISRLQDKNFNLNIASFSFSGAEEGVNYSLKQQVVDLAAVTKHLIKTQQSQNMVITATSMGAYSACWLSGFLSYSDHIKKIVFLDPADYYLEEHNNSTNNLHSWDGSDEFNPAKPVASDLLVGLNENIQVDVVRFSLKNCNQGDYFEKEYKNRGVDHPDGFPRLNISMVKGFFEKLPKKCQGKYLEQDNLPHGFNRDGDIEANNRIIADLIIKLSLFRSIL